MSTEVFVSSLYAKSMSVSDIESEMAEIYKINLSTSAISVITSKVSQTVLEWQNPLLDSLHRIIFKACENGKVINKTAYLFVGLNKGGLKEVLSMWVGKTEIASFWMGVLTDLKALGVEDILITVTDNLNGFTDTIKSVVHQIRNSRRYVIWKEKREFSANLKDIYNAPTKEVASAKLDLFEKKWGLNVFILIVYGKIIRTN